MQLDDITCLFIPTLSVFMGAIGTVKEICQNNEEESFDGLVSHNISSDRKMFFVYMQDACHMNFVIGLTYHRVSVAQKQSIGVRNTKV